MVHLNSITFTVQAVLLCLVSFSYDKVNYVAEFKFFFINIYVVDKSISKIKSVRISRFRVWVPPR